ncbi:MAG: class I SAM-dependent methyltransferase [Solirubrobacteraceae bacterium]
MTVTVPRCLACSGELAAGPALVARDRLHSIPGSWAVHECRACGSGTTLPLAREADLGAFYTADYAPYREPRGALAAAMAFMQRARDRRFPVATLSAAGAAGTLLDVGCGGGELAASWLHQGWRVQGVEPSSQAAAVARGRGVEIIGETLANTTLLPGSLSAVVFKHSLEHVVDPGRDLRCVAAALRPGGRVAVIVPNWGSWQRRFFGEHWFPLELPRHRTHFTAHGLKAALIGAGFSEVDVRPATPFITTAWSLQYRLFDRLLTPSGWSLLAGYACCVPVAAISRVLDGLRGGGDFLHAAAVRGA